MKILDNERKVLEKIPDNMLKVLYEFPNQFRKAEKNVEKSKVAFNKKFKNAIILAVGSSTNTVYKLINSIDIDKVNIPIVICSRPTIPTWVNRDTLAVAVTHSGNSIEILEATEKALKAGATVIAITTGGRLKEMAIPHKNMILLEYEADMISRMAVGCIYVFITSMLSKAGAIEICSDKEECFLGIDWIEVENALTALSKELSPDVRISENIAKRTAINLFGNVPIIYGSNMLTGAIAYRLKSQICLNSSNFAHYHTIPELDHDEIAAWGMRHELRNNFFVLFVTDNDSKESTKKRVEILKGLFMEKRIHFEEITLEGANDAIKGFSGVLLADWISVYLALLNRVDPISSKMLDLMKSRFERVIAYHSEEEEKEPVT